jgi:hypothetical protein
LGDFDEAAGAVVDLVSVEGIMEEATKLLGPLVVANIKVKAYWLAFLT